MKCARCDEPAKRRVLLYSRRSPRLMILDISLCDVHVQAELTLASTGLSMVDLDIKPLS